MFDDALVILGKITDRHSLHTSLSLSMNIAQNTLNNFVTPTKFQALLESYHDLLNMETSGSTYSHSRQQVEHVVRFL